MGGRSLFSIGPILLNLIVIAILVGAYYYILNNFLFIDYLNYIYWTINVLITYNIIAASARSFLAPILAILVALGSVVTTNMYGISFLSNAEFWQLLIVGGIGFFITIMLKL